MTTTATPTVRLALNNTQTMFPCTVPSEHRASDCIGEEPLGEVIAVLVDDNGVEHDICTPCLHHIDADAAELLKRYGQLDDTKRIALTDPYAGEPSINRAAFRRALQAATAQPDRDDPASTEREGIAFTGDGEYAVTFTLYLQADSVQQASDHAFQFRSMVARSQWDLPFHWHLHDHEGC